MTIVIGNKYKDEEGFVWEVRNNQQGKMVIECDDLMAREELFPRLNSCKQI